METGTLEVAGIRLAWRAWGDGEPVLCLCGTGDVSASFEPLAAALADRWRVVAYDARDTGASDRVAGAYTPSDLALDASGVVEALELGPCHVVGFSLGGATAMELALARPERVRSLVLLSTWGRSDRFFRHQMANWQAVRRATIGDERAFLTALNPWMFSPATLDDDARLAAIGDAWLQEPLQEPEAFLRQVAADAAHDALDRLAVIDVPALVIVGDDDVCTPPRYARQLVEALPDARLERIPDAGHCALYEQPDAVHAAIRRFLSEPA